MDDDEVLVDPYEIRIAATPFTGDIAPHWADRATLPQERDATGVQNWDFFDGAIVGVGVADPKRFVIYGSGVMVAPGVVITASHNINAHYDSVLAGEEQLHCIAIRRDRRAELWTLRRWRWPDSNSDISFLNVEICTELPEGWSCSCLPLSTRAPRAGETLSVVGFRFKPPNRTGRIGTIEGNPILTQGSLYISTGRVQRLWYPRRDPKRISFPAIQIGCDTLGGMSGGPALDADGNVVGILSTSMETSRGKETYIAWILQAFMFELGLVWPPGLYPEEPTLLDIPESLIKIVGRDKVVLTGNLEIAYDWWPRPRLVSRLRELVRALLSRCFGYRF